MSRRRYRRPPRKIAGAGLLLVALLLLALAEVKPWQNGWQSALGQENLQSLPAGTESSGLSLHMIDVGQGDGMLLTCNGAAALVDTGTSDSADEFTAYLTAQGVTGLEYVFITHPHADHYGGAKAVFADFPVETLVIPQYIEQDYELAMAADWIGAANSQIDVTYAGRTYDLGGAELTVLSPPEDNDIDEMNDLSIVLLVRYGGVKLLLTGDATAQTEKNLPPIGQVDLLKVGHHGSNGSSSQALLEELRPKLAFISCGAGNSYGHPNEDTLERLASVGSQVYRTDLSGTLVARVKEGKLTVSVQRQ